MTSMPYVVSMRWKAPTGRVSAVFPPSPFAPVQPVARPAKARSAAAPRRKRIGRCWVGRWGIGRTSRLFGRPRIRAIPADSHGRPRAPHEHRCRPESAARADPAAITALIGALTNTGVRARPAGSHGLSWAGRSAARESHFGRWARRPDRVPGVDHDVDPAL